VFITTSQDLPAHEEQRTRTLTLIDRFDQAGASRLADQNRVVLEQLDLRIEQIKQVLAARTVHDAG
jgi:hypothetical protein